ncbi:MAG: NGG1p interacting factor [Gammaproteobacteria bacterium]|nr:NGG1p interacting factor [Gammaproteobacteria bacterium]
MYHLYFYVPRTHLEVVKAALFAAGAGSMGGYDQVCWQTEGTGQFRPLPGSQPHIGKPNMLEKLDEYKVEMICRDDKVDAVIQALRKAHPYEEPAYGMLKIIV